MKKRILASIILIMITALFLIACGGDADPNDPTNNGGHTHSYTVKHPGVTESVVTEPTCTQKGIYYYICSCGAVGEETYEGGYRYHSFSRKIEDEAHLAKEADCNGAKTYYYSCTDCDAISDTYTFTSGSKLEHSFDNNLCIYGCGTELNEYTLSDGGDYYTLTRFSEDVEVAVIPETYKSIPVKSIGSFAFSSTKVREVVLPSSVDTIEENAFSNRTSLEKINLDGVKTIGDSAFAFCSSLSEINIGAATKIGAYSFSRTGIAEVTIPEGALEIGCGAFYNCPLLTKINYLATNAADLTYPDSILGKYDSEATGISLYIGDGVERIPGSMFAYSVITEIEFSENSVCRVIGDNAFYNCLGEKTLELTSVETVGARAFYGSEITELTLGGNINVIKGSAFASCNKLTTVTISANGGGFEMHAFAGCENPITLYYLHEGNETIGSAFMGSEVHLIFGKNVKTVPDEFEKSGIYTVSFEEGAEDVKIGRYAFVSSIGGTLDLSCVSSIDAYAFWRSGIDRTLERVILGKGLESIGTYAFGEVKELIFLAESCADVTVKEGDTETAPFLKVETVRIGKDATRIPGGMFVSAKIDTVIFEDGNDNLSIGNEAFFYANIKNLNFPEFIKSVGASAFEGVEGVLNKIDLNSVTQFGIRAFRYYEGEIDISNSIVEQIPEGAFESSGVVGEINLYSTKRLGKNAFYGCEGITGLVFGEGFLSADSGAFSRCTNIENVDFYATAAEDLSYSIFSVNSNERNFSLVIGSEVTKIPSYMFAYSAVTSITFEDESRCTSIGRYAFAYTYRMYLQEIQIPDSVERIEEAAFALTRAQTVMLGTGISYIGNGALCAMGIEGNEEHGSIEKIYFSKDVALVVTEIESGEEEILYFNANSDEDALSYAKIFFRAGYTYTVEV